MKKRFSPKKTAAFCTVSVLLALIIWTVWGNTALMVSTVAISSSRIPPAFSGFRIAQVSDLHNAEFGKDNSTLLRMLSESGPDIIVITGDLVDSTHTDIDTALSFAKEAVQIAPVYYVTGNHEARLTEYGRLRTGLETAGVTVLEDKTVWLEQDGGKIMLIGLSDPDFTVKGDMFGEAPSMVGTKLESLAGSEGGYTILLSHRQKRFVKDFFIKFTENLHFRAKNKAGNLFLDSRPMVLLCCPFCFQFFYFVKRKSCIFRNFFKCQNPICQHSLCGIDCSFF